MDPKDKVLQCAECGQNFTFTAADQAFYASRGYTNEPKRCPTCREARRGQRGGGRSSGAGGYGGGGGYRGPREMYPAVCASCGKETQVPFQPREGRPVYCNECYLKVRVSSNRQ